MKHESDFITIELANGGFILSYEESNKSDGITRDVREVAVNQRKLINRLKELLTEKSLVGVE